MKKNFYLLDFKKISYLFLCFYVAFYKTHSQENIPSKNGSVDLLQCLDKYGKNSFRDVDLVDKKVFLKDLPGYFFKIDPSGRFATYSISPNNYLLDLETGNYIKLPGITDAVFSKDGDYFSTPMKKNFLNNYVNFKQLYQDETNAVVDSDQEGLAFYDSMLFINALKDANKKGLREKEIPEIDLNFVKKDFQSKIKGAYQSHGKTSKGEEVVLTDENKATLVFYNRDLSGKVNIKKKKRVCGNIKESALDLPVLSPDGQFISSFNSQTKTTQVYKIDKKLKCKLVLDFGFPTGKVNFSSDMSQLTFHIDQFGSSGGSYFSGISSQLIKDVMVVKIKKNKKNDKWKIEKSSRLTATKKSGDGSYYPIFSNNNDVIMLTEKSGNYSIDKIKNTSFVWENTILPKKIKKSGSDCVTIDNQLVSFYLIAELLIDACHLSSQPTLEQKIFFAQLLKAEDCEQLVKESTVDAESISKIIKKVKLI